MTREIKFRAWDGFGMYDVGSLIFSVEKVELVSHNEYILDMNDIKLMQFTGLKDSKGVEIYEGDICKYWMDGRWKVGSITWERGGWAIHVVKYGDKVLDVVLHFQSFIPMPVSHITMQDQFEVIGDIYENPELLSV